MRTKVFSLFLGSVFIIIFLIFLKGLKNPNFYEPKVKNFKNIPIFDMKLFDTDKKINSLEVFKNDKFYLMNIWSSWCVPCRDEHVFLLDLSNQKNIEIIGLNYKDNNKMAKNFLNELQNPYKMILIDENGTSAIEWGAYGVPESFLIHKKKIIKKIIGPIDEKLFKEIRELIK